MPFQSEKQRRYMHANLPEIANRWERDYAGGGIAELNQELNSLPAYYLPKNQGGRIGYNKGLKVSPIIDITHTSQTPVEGIDVDVSDKTYGVQGMYQGDSLYGGGEYIKGKVNVNVQKDGNTIFEDSMSKDDLMQLYLGIGEREGNHVEVGTDGQGNYTLNIVKSFNQGGFVPAHQAGIYGLAEGGQLVKPGPGRPGYGGPHETYGGGVEAGRDPDPPDYSGGDNINVPINPHFDSPAVKEKQVKTDELNRRIRHRNEWRDRTDKKKDWVNENLDTVDTGLKLKKFVGSGNPLDLLKVNPVLLGGSYLYNKFKDKDKDKTLGLTDSIDFGIGLGDDEKVLGDTDFSEIEGDVAFKVGSKKDKKLKALHNERKAVIDLQNLGMDIEFDSKKEQEYQDLKKEDQEQTTEPKTILVGAEGGIAGLKQGGRIGFFTGMREAEQREQATRGPRDDPDRFGPTTTPTTTTRTRIQDERQEDFRQQQLREVIARGPGSDEEKYDTWDQQFQDIPGTTKTSIYKNKALINNARNQWEQVKDSTNTWLKKKAGKKLVDQLLLGGATFGLSDVIGGIVQAFKTNKAKNEFINTIKGSIKNYQDLGIPEHSPHKDTLIQDLNQELLDLTQTRSIPEDGGPDGPIAVASITYDDIEDTNRKKRASMEWRRKQEEVDRSKQMAYWQMMMTPHMGGATPKKLAAQGGRIPGGYNTGGLSNLFRLKNR